MIEAARSITHQHLLSVVNTEWQQQSLGPARPLTLLDLGCGDGALLGYLARNLPLLNPGMRLELYGLEVDDSRVQPPGFLERTVADLSASLPEIPWRLRIAGIAAADPWPYGDESFDVILSNQVLEHVADPDHLFAETYRALRPGGYAVHLFPLRHYLFEGHLKLPLAHRIQNFDLLRAYIASLSRLGLGKYPAHHRTSGISLAEYAERHADYLHHFTNYLSHRQVLALGKRHHLRVSFRYTREFYTSKLRALFGLPPVYLYALRRSALIDRIVLSLAKYISSVTLFLTKKQTY